MKYLMMLLVLVMSASAQTRIATTQFGCPASTNGSIPTSSVVMSIPITIGGIPTFMVACIPLDSSLQIVNGKLAAIAPSALASPEVVGETPTGITNGVNKVFTLRGTPITGTLKLYWNGLRQKEIADCSLSGSTITFVSAPEAGAVLLADYHK